MNKRIIHIAITLMMIIALLFTPSMIGSSYVMAEAIIASGNCNGMSWEITSDYLLILGNKGETQTFYGSGEDASYPWTKYNDSIKTITMNGVVKAEGSLERVFADCYRLSSADLSKLDTRDVTSMADMFNSCFKLYEVNISDLDTSNVKYMTGMFRSCQTLRRVDLSSINTNNLICADEMFGECWSLTEANLSNFGGPSLENTEFMFYDCKNLKSINLMNSCFDSVRNMRSMFEGCASLESLDLSGVHNNVVEEAENMFYFMRNVKQLDLSGFDFSNLDQDSFYNEHYDEPAIFGANRIESLKTPANTKFNVLLPYSMYDSKANEHKYLPTESAFIELHTNDGFNFDDFVPDDEEKDEAEEDYYPAITKDEAVKLVADAIKKHKKKVKFISTDYFRNDDEVYKYLDEVFYLATNGMTDYYLLGVFSSYGTSIEIDGDDFGAVGFEFGYETTKTQDEVFEIELKKVMKSLKLNGKSKKTKAKKIYSWITKNVKYGNCKKNIHLTAYSALVNRKAVCQGVASLYYRMLKEAGVEAVLISGKGENEPHGWVLVKIGNKWYNTDPTWDLGAKKYRYLFKTDKYFTKTHHKRYKEYRTKEFVKNHPMGKKNL